jgi:hypothetical protein
MNSFFWVVKLDCVCSEIAWFLAFFGLELKGAKNRVLVYSIFDSFLEDIDTDEFNLIYLGMINVFSFS